MRRLPAPRFRRPGSWTAAALTVRIHGLSVVGLALSAGLASGQVKDTPIEVLSWPGSIVLRPVLRIGKATGLADSFGRITDVLVDPSGRIFVSDLSAHHVAVFDSTGRRVGTLGRNGEGPGEFRSPWTLALGRGDTLFVVDLALGRVSLFSPGLAFARSFRITPSWGTGFLAELRDGSLLVTGLREADGTYFHRLARDGALLESAPFNPLARYEGPPLYGHEQSLLGGKAVVEADGYVFANKSPYEVIFLLPDWTIKKVCQGDPGWTTRPGDVVQRTGRRVALNWNRFVHVAGIMQVGRGEYLVTTRDPIREQTLVDVLDRDCRIRQRIELPGVVSLDRGFGQRVVGVVETDSVEVVVYEIVRRVRG